MDRELNLLAGHNASTAADCWVLLPDSSLGRPRLNMMALAGDRVFVLEEYDGNLRDCSRPPTASWTTRASSTAGFEASPFIRIWGQRVVLHLGWAAVPTVGQLQAEAGAAF